MRVQLLFLLLIIGTASGLHAQPHPRVFLSAQDTAQLPEKLLRTTEGRQCLAALRQQSRSLPYQTSLKSVLLAWYIEKNPEEQARAKRMMQRYLRNAMPPAEAQKPELAISGLLHMAVAYDLGAPYWPGPFKKRIVRRLEQDAQTLTKAYTTAFPRYRPAIWGTAALAFLAIKGDPGASEKCEERFQKARIQLMEHIKDYEPRMAPLYSLTVRNWNLRNGVLPFVLANAHAEKRDLYSRSALRHLLPQAVQLHAGQAQWRVPDDSLPKPFAPDFPFFAACGVCPKAFLPQARWAYQKSFSEAPVFSPLDVLMAALYFPFSSKPKAPDADLKGFWQKPEKPPYIQSYETQENGRQVLALYPTQSPSGLGKAWHLSLLGPESQQSTRWHLKPGCSEPPLEALRQQKNHCFFQVPGTLGESEKCYHYLWVDLNPQPPRALALPPEKALQMQVWPEGFPEATFEKLEVPAD